VLDIVRLGLPRSALEVNHGAAPRPKISKLLGTRCVVPSDLRVEANTTAHSPGR
jgi:hypothetical protein